MEEEEEDPFAEADEREEEVCVYTCTYTRAPE